MRERHWVLVVGASGILAPAVAALLERDIDVVGIGRRPHDQGTVHHALDARDPTALRRSLAGNVVDAALVYEPATSAESRASITAAVSGRVVIVRSTDAVMPGSERCLPATDTLQLGWAAGAGSPRWHTPAEVSAAALDVLMDGQSRTLGVTRPWKDRP